MNLARWLYRGGRPNRVASIVNRCTAAVYALGIAPNYLVTLDVVGRRSGRVWSLPVVMAVVDGERYLAVLRDYLKRAPGARPHLPIHKDAPLSEFEQLSSQFQVFRIVPR